jgi:hypothetical protein
MTPFAHRRAVDVSLVGCAARRIDETNLTTARAKRRASARFRRLRGEETAEEPSFPNLGRVTHVGADQREQPDAA